MKTMLWEDIPDWKYFSVEDRPKDECGQHVCNDYCVVGVEEELQIMRGNARPLKLG